ncbi:hypothetical protein INT43_006097 [Umbelopsis isabellina]|uniref:6-phosphofructo-2-kinase domain-containing protein n=1 Tax=Mortierella isabellina TaxID=91625 RepID=A0A8H7PJU6_MORIS|nr:hypothetical protein INT43_006097 [Umbelopsis isabellina]
MAAQLYKTDSGRLFHAGAIAIVTVGLPARGKTHVSRSLCRYMRWLGVETQVFSVGNYRRALLGSMPNSWFDPTNRDAKHKRVEIANECLEDLISWITKDGGQVAVNADSAYFHWQVYTHVGHAVKHRAGIDRFPTTESICNKPEVVQANIRSVKISSPDKRIEQHMLTYETLADLSQPFVKLMNVGEQIIVNNVHGYLQPGPSENDNRYKEDPDLAPEGHEYAERLKEFILSYRARQRATNNKEEYVRPLNVWTSARKRSKQTALHFAFEEDIIIRQHTTLTQMNPGEVDGLTDEEIKARFPDEIAKAQKDPYRHRYPRAESYHDLAVRLEPVIMELEREKSDVLIIAHETVLRCLYAYLFDRTEQEIPRISIPRNILIEVAPTAYGAKESRMQFIEPPEDFH